jgi:MinD superfamily P-loop ATPase
MKIAVLSGKGGAGKTFVSVNLAAAAESARYLDCDAEEPNGHLFFKPTDTTEETVTVPLPVCDAERCTGCRTCVEFCRFNALAYVGDKWMVFPEVCHSCGGCTLVCPEQAISERKEPIGTAVRGTSGNVRISSGFLNTGEVSAIPIIETLLGDADADGLTVIDCPPGSACTVMESIRDADYCILVAEPTAFGVHNLQMVWELVSLFHKPHGVLINKSTEADNPAEAFCKENGVDVIARIPYQPTIAELVSEGKIAVREDEAMRTFFAELLTQIENTVSGEETLL